MRDTHDAGQLKVVLQSRERSYMVMYSCNGRLISKRCRACLVQLFSDQLF
jgi:hypothetical protein